MEVLPRLIAFDLDGTVWKPDMYELWGGGPPFQTTASPDVLHDSSSATVTLCGNIRDILHELSTSSHWSNTKVCYVSCTDEPSWAAACLDMFQTTEGAPLSDSVHRDLNQIYKANKQVHFQNLHKTTGVEYRDMLFFDNEKHNCETVSKLGVVCIHCQNGMNSDIWSRALETFARSRGH